MGFGLRKIYPRWGSNFLQRFFAISLLTQRCSKMFWSLSFVQKAFMQRAEIPDVSLPIGRGATQTLEALVVDQGHCSFAAMWMQVSGVKRWSAEILWNSLMWTLASANGSWNQRVKSRPSHWSSWMIELTSRKERWQIYRGFLQTTFTSINHCMINSESGSVTLMIYFCHSESIRSQPKRWTGYGSGLECGDCDLTYLWSLHWSSSFHVDLCQKESFMGPRWTKNDAGHCVHTPSFW